MLLLKVAPKQTSVLVIGNVHAYCPVTGLRLIYFNLILFFLLSPLTIRPFNKILLQELYSTYTNNNRG